MILQALILHININFVVLGFVELMHMAVVSVTLVFLYYFVGTYNMCIEE